jgi:ubiquitin-protein ligase
LDVYNGNINNMESSSICFDLVKPKNNPQSTWESDYTISTVFASIMQVIVSLNVDQMYGGVVQ